MTQLDFQRGQGPGASRQVSPGIKPSGTPSTRNAEALTAADYTTAPAQISVRFRRSLPADESYIVDSWRMSWRLADRNRSLGGADYGRKFDALVRGGVLAQRDTDFVVGCAPDDVNEIWSWLCFTPGVVPTVHFGVTKRAAPSLSRTPRGLGFFTRLLAAAGIRASLVYTFRPAERTHKCNRRPLHAERGLLSAAHRCGIAATYHSVEEFLAHRGVR